MEIVGDDIVLRVTGVYCWLEYLDLEIREFRPADPADQLLGLSREHGAADHLDLSGFFYVF